MFNFHDIKANLGTISADVTVRTYNSVLLFLFVPSSAI